MSEHLSGEQLSLEFKKKIHLSKETLSFVNRTIFNCPSQKCQWLQKVSANNFQMTIGRFETPP